MRRGWLYLAFIVMSACCWADELHLKDGVVVEGIVRETDEGYSVTFGTGAKTFIPKAQVIRHVKKLTDEQLYENLKLVLAEDDFEGQMKLGLWCRLHNLPDKAREHYELAVKLRPDDPKARRAAGYVFRKGKWYKLDEYMISQGKMKYKGKWIAKEVALSLIKKDKKEQIRASGYKAAWRLLKRAGKVLTDEEMDSIVSELKKLGESGYGAVIRCASDSNKKIRRVSLEVLATAESDDTLKELLRRFRYERDRKLFYTALKALVKHPKRDKVIAGMIKICVYSKSAKTRKRTWLAFEALADKSAIERLITLAEYSPVKVDETETEDDRKARGKDTGGKWITYEGEKDKPLEPYYPATEALNFLTKAGVSPSREQWEKWWRVNSATFAFKSVPMLDN